MYFEYENTFVILFLLGLQLKMSGTQETQQGPFHIRKLLRNIIGYKFDDINLTIKYGK